MKKKKGERDGGFGCYCLPLLGIMHEQPTHPRSLALLTLIERPLDFPVVQVEILLS